MFKIIWKNRVFCAAILAFVAQILHSTFIGDFPSEDFDMVQNVQIAITVFVSLMVFLLLTDLHLFELSKIPEIAPYRVSIIIGAFGTSAFVQATISNMLGN